MRRVIYGIRARIQYKRGKRVRSAEVCAPSTNVEIAEGRSEGSKMAIQLQDFKLPEQDTRLVLFGSTVFKLKYKMGSVSEHSL